MPSKVTPRNVAKAIDIYKRKFSHFKRNRYRFLQQMVGRFYSKVSTSSMEDPSERRASPINLLHTAVSKFVPNLVFRNPKITVRTQVLEFREYGETLALAVNHLFQQIRLRETLRKIVIDSIFSAGFRKTGFASNDQFIHIDGIDVVLGQPYTERVDPDNIILDPFARDWDEQNMIGDRFRVERSDLLELPGVNKLIAERFLSHHDDTAKRYEASNLIESPQGQTHSKELYDYVDLVEIYFPRDNRIVVVPDMLNPPTDGFLKDFEYEGPDTGPYGMLGYCWVPDNVMPVPPASIWFDLHIMGNRIARKISRQADRLKRVLAYGGQAVEDVEDISEADDGEAVRVNHPDLLKEINFGGVTEDAYVYLDWVKRQFGEHTDVATPSPAIAQVKTAAQGAMLQANASVQLADLQEQVHHFVAKIAEDLGLILHTDPLINLPLIKRDQGGEEAQVFYTPEMRRGDHLNYTYSIVPHSMGRQDPEMEMRRLLEIFTSAIPAVAQAAQLLGPGFKIDKALDRLFRKAGIDDSDEFMDGEAFRNFAVLKVNQFVEAGKAEQQGGGGGAQAGIPGSRPQQPLPQQMGPTGGVSPQTERARAQQEVSGEIQGAFKQPSTRSLALAR